MFSIITPTYNRENTLHRVYDSLKNQIFKEFHWLIIDDASTDDTELLVNGWIEESIDLKISYYKLGENKGKPFALNYGLNFCEEPITIIADSDDSFEPMTLLDLKTLWVNVNKTLESAKIAAIWTLVKDEDGNVIGEKFPSNFWQVNFEKRVLKRKRKVKGEKWHSWRTSILNEYKFYHNDNTIHIGESATWTRINKNYDFLCVNIIHRIYYHSADGLINQKKTKLKIAKVKYYTSYHQLCNTPAMQILKNRYYRYLAFEYIKANISYTDQEFKLKIGKKLICILPFITTSFEKLINRVI